jgi:hypothetical protein
MLWFVVYDSYSGVWHLLLTPQLFFIQIMAKFEIQPLYMSTITYARIRIVHDKFQCVNIALCIGSDFNFHYHTVNIKGPNMLTNQMHLIYQINQSDAC